MVPLHDNNPTKIKPWVNYGLIAINILVFIYALTLSPEQLQGFFQTFAIVPSQLTASFQSGNVAAIAGQSLTLITSQFLHGGFLHLGGNMLFLWVFGNNIEEKLGRVSFLFFYLTCGALAGLAQWALSMQSDIPMVGASGAIAGVLGAYILRFPKARILTLIPLGIFITTFRIPAIFFLGFWFFQQTLYGFASLQATTSIDSGGVAYWAHAGGFVVGLVLAPVLGLFRSSSPGPGRGRLRS
ncbi:rhomboid family intramembrane serine protease [Nodosilinea sp. E11]|uniref:rhomboid family intramembrane serine protease n=1 Tax=Nodosilinea sp. E11 TaxID=3037479 RepID=UPI0029342F00|nr:rhomboid family intramembrane serine protease [Nodosilinea sp. E11]WOD40213.1 rhomboid family intramembrane serine protease [Nodosilinea sp. E11]